VKLNLEIRPGEGGEDAKLLVQDQAAIYIKYANLNGIKVDVTNEDHG
jgi:protein subunit release factor A